MFHKVILVGHLGGDPQMRYTQDGTPVTSFSVATKEVWTERESGEKRERTIWWRVSAWRKQAEICNQYLAKGRLVLVEGTIAADANTGGPRIWTGQDGTARASYELTAQIVRFLGGKTAEAAAGGAEGAAEAPASEEDLPF